MNIAFQQMDDWYTTSPGRELLEAEHELLDPYLSDFYGTYLVQIGGAPHAEFAHKSPMTYHVYAGSARPEDGFSASIDTDFKELPFLPGSLDVILLPHVLEFAEQPQHILQESYHMLEPGGHLLMLGFNPASLWGISKLFNFSNDIPWNGKFHSVYKMMFWLKSIGFRIAVTKSTFYRWPNTSPDLLNKQRMMEAMGVLNWPIMGASYMIIAEKVTEERIKKTAAARQKLIRARPVAASMSRGKAVRGKL